MKSGELVEIVPKSIYPGVGPAVKGWETYPCDHGYHRAVWVGTILTVLLEQRNVYSRIMLPSGGTAWVESLRVKKVS